MRERMIPVFSDLYLECCLIGRNSLPIADILVLRYISNEFCLDKLSIITIFNQWLLRICFLLAFFKKEFSLATYYYSTQTLLAWCLNHYFYQANHWTYVGAYFYPYKETNPPSSNPLTKYQSIYEEWFDNDEFGAYINQLRLNTVKGVEANRQQLASGWEARLKNVCENIEVVFFYPIVYRVDVDMIQPITRLDNSQGSAVVGSKEYLIADLQETEFDILFFDFNSDYDIATLTNGTTSPDDVLSILESRC